VADCRPRVVVGTMISMLICELSVILFLLIRFLSFYSELSLRINTKSTLLYSNSMECSVVVHIETLTIETERLEACR